MMNTASYITEIADGLSSANRQDGFAQLFVVLLRELAKGKAVSREVLRHALGWPDARVAAMLDAMPDIEYDDRGDIAGYGITLRETPHAFEVDGHPLYVWCALDALMFPAMIGRRARVVSNCPATGARIALTVTPEQVTALEPPDAVISLQRPHPTASIRQAFCCCVHFFSSDSVGKKWIAQLGEAELIVTVEEAFQFGRTVGRELLGSAGVGPS
ncbi:organomercurial lyase MerB [Paraburkholderia fungorum]|jgi:alkylmercury lyase|uniref:Alkylmercury lyase n=1 Tax=Paraburkholderia fungorum TaxID=134537 RepID=A0AAP5Q5E3_9BURK|nr:organomercurial lyase MerB [Paraburkholderia fungorum]MDT8835834.1 organomercurial lyase MerB [Paraburkholderia fungorum]